MQTEDQALRHSRACSANNADLMERAVEQGMAVEEGGDYRWLGGYGPADVQWREGEEVDSARAPGGVLKFVKIPCGALQACHDGLVYNIERRDGDVRLWIDTQDEGTEVADLITVNGKETTVVQMAEAFAKCWTGGAS